MHAVVFLGFRHCSDSVEVSIAQVCEHSTDLDRFVRLESPIRENRDVVLPRVFHRSIVSLIEPPCIRMFICKHSGAVEDNKQRDSCSLMGLIHGGRIGLAH